MKSADEVNYFTVDGCDRLKFFRCEPYRATLSTGACAERWKVAQQAVGYDADRFEKCRACPIGAEHAGQPVVIYSCLYGKSICPRTRRWAPRLIHGRLSVSAYNRQLEFRKGANGRGTKPRFRFDPRRIGVVIDGAYTELRDEYTADALELVVQALRVATGRIMFTRVRGGATITTADLAARFRQAPERPLRGATKPGGRWRRRAT
jgi:hypothetical protein